MDLSRGRPFSYAVVALHFKGGTICTVHSINNLRICSQEESRRSYFWTEDLWDGICIILRGRSTNRPPMDEEEVDEGKEDSVHRQLDFETSSIHWMKLQQRGAAALLLPIACPSLAVRQTHLISGGLLWPGLVIQSDCSILK